MTKKYPFDHDGRYAYGFTSSGFFTLINRDGEPLYDATIPLCEKLGSHLIWIFLWIVLIIASNLLLPDQYVFIIDCVLMSLIFFHLFLFGCRLTTLLLKGGFRPVFFPPLWMRLTRQLQKGEGLECLKEHKLEEHPGLLVNLALIQFTRDQKQEGQQTLRRALSLCPDHPAIQQIFSASAQLSQ